MKKILSTFMILSISFSCTRLCAQSPADPINFPTVVPPSPDAQGFMQYGAYPVDYCTGIPKIDIPLYEIKSGQLDLPISLSYHGGGIRVNDIASVPGLGWSLNAGGMVSRTVMGLPDENIQGIFFLKYLTSTDIDYAAQSATVYNQLNYVAAGDQDAQSDNYFYSTGTGLSGQFVYDSSLHLTPLTYTTDKITSYPGNNPYNSNSLNYKITADDGTQYTFGNEELMLFQSANWYPTTWWLSSIVSADKTDTISFQYEQSSGAYNTTTQVQSSVYGLNSAGTGSTGLLSNITSTRTYQLLLKQINFRNGYVQFAYDSDRIDMRPYRLISVSIYNSANTLLKQYRLAQHYMNSGDGSDQYNYRLMLDSLSMYDGAGNYTNKYSFVYNKNDVLPPYFTAQSTYTENYAQDYWGFYNGNTSNPTLIPYLPSPAVAGNRQPNAFYAEVGTLISIYFPTGGFSTYNYESNIDYEGNVTGGLRVHSIVTQADSNSAPLTKQYVYTNNILNYTQADPDNYNYQQQMFNYNSGTCANWVDASTIYLATPLIPLFTHNGAPALYQIVDEYTDGGSGGNLKTEYTYLQVSDVLLPVNAPRYPDGYPMDMSWQRGQLAGVAYYKLLNDGNYKLVKQVSNVYSPFYSKSIVSGTTVQVQTTYPGTSSCFLSSYPGGSMSQYFYYFDVIASTGTMKMTAQYINEYDDNNDTLTDTKTYTYGSSYHLFPTLITHLDSKGDTLKTQLLYPTDFLSTPVYDSLYTRNSLSPVVEQLDYKDSGFLSSATTNYNYWGNGVILPQTVTTQLLTNPVDTRLHFHGYDPRGNLLWVSKDSGASSSFIWDYKSTYPIAKCTNADTTSIAYTSFEADGTGRWTFSGSATAGSNCPTGNYYYYLGQGSISKTGLLSGNSYVVSYWSSTGSSYTVTGSTSVVQGKTINGWTYFEHTVTGTSTVTVSGSGNIDELRLYPSGAQMTTYTYTPLVGMTSQCDVDNRVTYYFYDPLARLKYVKDQDGNIIKTYQYHYQGGQ